MRQFMLITILIALFSISAGAASIVRSPHDLSFSGDSPYTSDYHHRDHSTPAAQWNDYNEICIYCHTPHNAQTSVPLWNRQLTSPGSFTPYQSASMHAATSLPSETSRLCLSCHDGTIALDAIGNVGSSPIWTSPDGRHSKMDGQCEQCHTSNQTGECTGGGCHNVSPDSYYEGSFFALDLSNDHPVSIDYLPAADLKPKPIEGKFTNGVMLFEDKVECPSCHDVHDPGYKPFLRTSNAGSALCYTCHDK